MQRNKMKTLIFALLLTGNVNAHEAGEHQDLEKKALAEINRLGKNLKTELQKAMKVSPVNALKVCNTKAMPLTQEVSKAGIKVGRVSLKNRNPKNKPAGWMMETITAYHNGMKKEPYSVVQLPNGKHGILKPIKTMPLCLKCHGTDIDPKLQKKISELYPQDKATGYQNNQIRGFFFAEY